MNTAFIIAEYHPFHNGHARMIEQLRIRGFDTIAVIQSGNLVQRGTPALLPKQVRVAAALRCGADLVLELPCLAAASTAERFAAAGVAAAAASGCASVLAFGAEQPELTRLEAVVDALNFPDYSLLLKAGLEKGLPFFTARSRAAEALCPGAAQLLARPNNILAVEYLKALRCAQAAGCRQVPKPLAVPRFGTGHDSAVPGTGLEGEAIASASHLRTLPVEAWQPFVPAQAFPLYRAAFHRGLVLQPERWECAVLALLRSRTRQQLASIPGGGEGLDALLYTAVRECTTLEDVYTRMKSKRYAHARIRRLVLAAALGWQETAAFSNGTAALTPQSFYAHSGIPYLRVLGASSAGLPLLSALGHTAEVPVSTSLAQLERLGGDAAAAAVREARAGDLYALCLQAPQPCGEDYRLPFLREDFDGESL